MRAFVRGCQAILGIAVLFGSAAPSAASEDESPAALAPATHWVGVTPTWTHAFVAGSVSHEALGLTFETFLGRRIGVALVSALYSPFSTEPPQGRPVSKVDPAHRSFAYDARLAAANGAVARVFVQRELALSFDVRHLMYVDVNENALVASERDDPSTWFGDKVFVNAIEARLGLTLLTRRATTRCAFALPLRVRGGEMFISRRAHARGHPRR